MRDEKGGSEVMKCSGGDVCMRVGKGDFERCTHANRWMLSCVGVVFLFVCACNNVCVSVYVCVCVCLCMHVCVCGVWCVRVCGRADI